MRLINAYSMLGLTTLQDVRQYADRMGNLLVTMRNHVQQYQQQAQNLIDQYQLDVQPWLLPNEHLVSIVPAVITMPDQLHLNDVGIPEPSSNLGRVDANISQSIAALKIRIEQEKRVVMRHYVEREWQTFHAARTAGDFENFLIQYRSTDQAGLVPQANSILNQLLKPQVPLAPMPVASSTSVAEKIQLVQQPAKKAPSVTLTQTTRPTDSIQK